MYLSKEAIGCQVISAKSSEMNISVPKENGEFVRFYCIDVHIYALPYNWNTASPQVEYAIAEQFKSLFDGKTFVTEPTENTEWDAPAYAF